MTTAIWWTGSGVRRRRAEQAEHERLAAEAASATERARIARELPDARLTGQPGEWILPREGRRCRPTSNC